MDLERLERATAALEAPFALLDLDALEANAADMERRAAGTPIRLASKSIRCRPLTERLLAGHGGFRGVLAFTLPEALWLADHGFDDLVVAYPTADRTALRRLAEGPHTARVTVMVDSVAHLDLIEAATGDAPGPVRVAIDVDASWWALRGRLKVGAKRSPLRTPGQAAALAREVRARRRLALDGLMTYEAQIAGVGDRPPGRPVMGLAVRALQRASARELATRRAAVVQAVSAQGPLRFVNGGGTGSIEATAAEPAVTEVAAGSGLYGPTLFDAYRRFTPRPAALFALPVVRRSGPGVATALGGGYPASGAAGRDKLPTPFLPAGLRLDRTEGAGEVQTPVLGEAAGRLSVGDRVWMRHAKAGELCERFDRLYVLSGDRVVDELPTYRGEGMTFL
jgi:D-serine deaminase-like pyridoxal phosphate-dependent protein